jgi:hypothetical protein
VAGKVENLKEVLAESSFPEQKAFIRSFANEVRVTGKDVLVTYTMPLSLEKGLLGSSTVLDIVHYGGPKSTKSITFALAFSLPN